MNVNTLRSVIAESDDFKTVTVVPLEDSRLFADSEDIERYFTRLDEVISVGRILADDDNFTDMKALLSSPSMDLDVT